MAIVATLNAFKTPHQPHVIENVVTERLWPMHWASPRYFMAMASATGRTIYIQAPALAPIPITAQGELSKAVAQTRAAKAAAPEQTRSEASWAR
ncbi:hypothetical protein AB0L53_46985 [Nonomuraea sp. NPDC052129]|uniref:hypothetical protein n=1 Tax=Nonomuraea sp. NPDC052129 TaxID=3154651 RepID=UPI003433BAE1